MNAAQLEKISAVLSVAAVVAFIAGNPLSWAALVAMSVATFSTASIVEAIDRNGRGG